MNLKTIILGIWILAPAWGCRSVPDGVERDRVSPEASAATVPEGRTPEGPARVSAMARSPEKPVGARSDHGKPANGKRAPVGPEGKAGQPAEVRSVRAEPAAAGGLPAGEGGEPGAASRGPLEHEAGVRHAPARPPGSPPERGDLAGGDRRGSRSYLLDENDDTAVHLEVWDRPPDEPEMHLDATWPRRVQTYSRPPERILRNLRRVYCVPCPGR